MIQLELFTDEKKGPSTLNGARAGRPAVEPAGGKHWGVKEHHADFNSGQNCCQSDGRSDFRVTSPFVAASTAAQKRAGI